MASLLSVSCSQDQNSGITVLLSQRQESVELYLHSKVTQHSTEGEYEGLNVKIMLKLEDMFNRRAEGVSGRYQISLRAAY